MPKSFQHSRVCPPFPKSKLTYWLVGVWTCCFSANILAQNANSAQETLSLKLEDQLLVRPPVLDEQSPTFTSSKKVDGVVDRVMKLEGDAVMRRNRTVIKGDVITYDPDTDIADIEGNAVLLKETTYFKGPRAKLRLDAQEGWMDTPIFELRNIGGSGEAQRVDFLPDDQIEFQKLKYTTCRPDNVDWYIKASRMDVEQDTNSAVGRNGVLHFFNVPVLYTPAFALPTNSERRSGFLSPTYGRSNRNGWDIRVPYYINIAPNRDMTLFPRYLQNRGEQIGTEFRYLDRNYAGTLTAEYLSDDKLYKKDRWAFGIKHVQNVTQGIQAYSDFSKVSDDFYVDDVGRNLSGVVNRQFNQEIGARTAIQGWTVLTRVQKFQTLQPDPTIPTVLPYEREPQINARYGKMSAQGFQWNVETDFTRFTLPNRQLFINPSRVFSDGNRAYVNTSVARPFLTPGYYFTPKVSLRSVSYDVNQFQQYSTGGNFNRNITLPTLSLDSGMVLERDAFELKPMFGRNMLMTLEPRAFYVYTPYRQQSDLPIFDTADAGFGIAQIFSENTFAGNDRIADNNKLTVGVTSRFIDADSGVERFRTIFAQRTDFDGQRVGLYSESTTPARKRSDLLAGLSTRLAGNFNVDGVAQYNEDIAKIVQQTVTLGYRPELRKLVNVSYRRTIDPTSARASLDQYEISGQWPITRKWYGVARYNYDLISDRVLNRLMGLEYDADCWVVRVVQRRFQNTTVLATSEIFMQIDFKGFSGFGSNPINLIRFNVPGYEPVSVNPAPISPFESYE